MGAGAAGAAGGAAAGGAAGAGGAAAGASGLSKAMPFIGMGMDAVGMGMSLVESSAQQGLQAAADRAAEDALKEQKRLQGQNFFKALQVPMEAYNRAAKETTAQQQQAVSALQEGDPRLLVGAIGKVNAVAQEGEAETRDALAADLYQLGAAQAKEEGDTADKMAGILGTEVAGAGIASANAANASIEQQQGALASAGNIITGLGAMIPEYPKTKGATSSGTGPNKAFQSPIENQYSDDPFAALKFLNKPK